MSFFTKVRNAVEGAAAVVAAPATFGQATKLVSTGAQNMSLVKTGTNIGKAVDIGAVVVGGATLAAPALGLAGGAVPGAIGADSAAAGAFTDVTATGLPTLAGEGGAAVEEGVVQLGGPVESAVGADSSMFTWGNAANAIKTGAGVYKALAGPVTPAGTVPRRVPLNAPYGTPPFIPGSSTTFSNPGYGGYSSIPVSAEYQTQNPPAPVFNIGVPVAGQSPAQAPVIVNTPPASSQQTAQVIPFPAGGKPSFPTLPLVIGAGLLLALKLLAI